MRTSSSSQSTGGSSTPEHRRDVEVDRRPIRAPARTDSRARVDLGRVDGLRELELRAHVLAVLVGPGGKRRAVRLAPPRGRRAATCRRAARGSRPRRRARRAPRAARRTPRRRGSPGSAGPPTDGGLVSSPTVSPSSRGGGTGSPVEHRPHRRDLRDGPRHRPDGVERRAEREDAVGRDPAPARLQPDDAAARRRAAGSSSRYRCRGRCRTCRRRARPRCRPRSRPSSGPGATGFCTVPYHGFWLVTPQANSCRFALPTTTAPARRAARPRRRRVGTWSA